MEDVLANLLLSEPMLVAIVNDRVDWDETPQGQSGPRIVMRVISVRHGYTFQGVDGLFRHRIQFDCHAGTSAEAKTMADTIGGRLSGYRGVFEGVHFQAAFHDGERSQSGKDDTGAWALRSVDYFIWSARA